MPEGWLQGVPIGMVMLAGMVFAAMRRRVSRNRSQRLLPEVCAELGLKHRTAVHPNGMGTFYGDHQGLSILVDPEDQRLLAVRFPQGPRIDLRSYEHGRGAPHGMVAVHTNDRAFNRYFKTRFASPPLAEALANWSRPSELLRAFEGRFSRQVSSLSVTDDGVTCRLDFGSPPHIPAAALRELLPACVELARTIRDLEHDAQPPASPRASPGKAAREGQ